MTKAPRVLWFSVGLVGPGTIPSLVTLLMGTVTSDSSEWYFPWPLVVYSEACADQVSTEDLQQILFEEFSS